MSKRITLNTLLILALAVGLLGCNKNNEAKPTEAKASAPEVKKDETKKDETKKDEAHPMKEGEHGEPGVGSTPLSNPEPKMIKGADGKEIAHYGADFSLKEAVAVSALLANPAQYEGKTVRVKGDISAMCHHKRGWFAVTAEDKSGKSLRIITMPVFLVPEGSIGKTGLAEGKIEIIEVPAKFAAHMNKEHGLGEKLAADNPNAKVKQVIIRATSAEFL